MDNFNDQFKENINYIIRLRHTFDDALTHLKEDGAYRQFEKVNKRKNFKSHR